MICTPHRGSSLTCARHLMSIHAVSVSLRIWALHSIQLPLLFIHLQSLALPPALLPRPWGQWQHCVLRLKGDGLYWRVLPPHRLWAQEPRPHGHYDDTVLKEMLHNAHRVHVYHSHARRLVCRSVVVVRAPANGATCWRANRATWWTNWSGAKCTD